MKNIMRVFPVKTNGTPTDSMVRIGCGPAWFDECDEVHVSVAFTRDLEAAEKLEKEWKHVAPVRVGGPALGAAGSEFVAGRYLKRGYTITSRGCPNRCWFCSVWKREGYETRELPIVEGWNILDDNLLACSETHIRAVFAMLSKQNRKPEFTGGLEAKRLQLWHAQEMRRIKTEQAFFAYDTPDDLEPLREAGRIMLEGGMTYHALRCYVLCGSPKDTKMAAIKRFLQAWDAGFTPMAMVYMDKNGQQDEGWLGWARQWIRPAIVKTMLKHRRRSAV